MTRKTVADWKARHHPETVIANLQAELTEARAEQSTAEMVREFVGTTKLALEQVKPPSWTVSAKPAKSPGIPTLCLSDLHWGESVKSEQIGGVNSYDLNVARRRLRTVVETTISVARILDPDMRYTGIVVPLGGDMISGNIHEELQATNELNTMPTLLDLYKHLVPAIKLLADTFGNVFLPCVTGNHDRDTKKIWSKDRQHTSFSWLLYQFLGVAFADDKRVSFYIPDSSDAMYRIYGLRYLLTHGDQFRAGDSIIGPIGPILRGEQKKLAARQAVNQDYDVMVFGHWHRRLIDQRLRGNGTLKGYDEWAAQNNFRPEPASQNFWITHPDYGITFDVPVFGDLGAKGAGSLAWVSWPK